jgi:hypothetical protein
VELHRSSDVSQQLVTGRMPLAVVDLLEPVDVNEREHESSASMPGAVDLTFEHDHAKLATERTGELIEPRLHELVFRLLAITLGGSAIGGGALTVGGPERALCGRARTQLRRMSPCTCCRGRKPALQVQPRGGAVALLGGAVAGFGAQIAQTGVLITPLAVFDTFARCLRSRPARLSAFERTLTTLGPRLLIYGAWFAPCAAVGAVAIRGGLISVRGPLVGIRLGLVVIRRRLITVRSTLVRLGRRLINRKRLPALDRGDCPAAFCPAWRVRGVTRINLSVGQLASSPGDAAPLGYAA